MQKFTKIGVSTELQYTYSMQWVELSKDFLNKWISVKNFLNKWISVKDFLNKWISVKDFFNKWIFVKDFLNFIE